MTATDRPKTFYKWSGPVSLVVIAIVSQDWQNKICPDSSAIAIYIYGVTYNCKATSVALN